MSNRIASIISNDGTISLMLDSSSYSINREHPNYEAIKVALREGDADKLSTLVDIPRAVKTYTSSVVDVVGGVVHWNGKPLHNSLTARIMNLMGGGFPFRPMLKFLENLMQNPSMRAVNELYDFLDHKNLPITEDGCFLAYKGTRVDGFDKYSGTILNEVGTVVEIPRNEVDDNREQECSHGLHVGHIEYVREYCTERVIIVKVNPRDCVSVPRDHNATKLRVCRYEILSIYQGDLGGLVYNSDGTEWKSPPLPLEQDDDCYDRDSDDYSDDNYCERCYEFLNFDRSCPNGCDEEEESEDEEEEKTEEVNENEWSEDDWTDYPGGRYWNVRDKSGRFVKR